MPKAPKIISIVPVSVDTPQQWDYTFNKPGENWFKTDFNAVQSGWQKGPAGFGTRNTPGAVVRTVWRVSDVWLRREFELKDVPKDLRLGIHHDEDAEVYLNGILAAKLSGYTTGYETFPIANSAIQKLKPGVNIIAIHCHQTQGGQYIDAGLVEVIEQE